MTVEHRVIVGLSDIRAITFECVKCGARLSVAPGKVDTDTLRECPTCTAPWLTGTVGTGRVQQVPVTRFVDAIAPALVSEQHDEQGVRVLFEFAEPKP